jgi:hypothetical protein
MYKLGSPVVILIGIQYKCIPLVKGTVLHSGLKRKGDSCVSLAVKSLSSHAMHILLGVILSVNRK